LCGRVIRRGRSGTAAATASNGARSRFGVDEARPIGEFWRSLPGLLDGHERLFHRLGADAEFDRRLLEVFAARQQRLRRRQPPAHPALIDPLPAIAAMRLQKDSAELDAHARGCRDHLGGACGGHAGDAAGHA
jgi:Xaa-Pro aminopeptidase